MSWTVLAFYALLILVVLLCAVFRLLFYVPTLRQLWMLRRLPGPRCLPVIGPVHRFIGIGALGIEVALKKLAIEGYDRVAAFWMIGMPVVYVNSPQDLEVLLSNVKYIDKGVEYDTIRPWLLEGLLLSSGAKWHMRRKLLTPTFHFKILEDSTQTMYVHARKFVNKLLEKKGRPFEPYRYITRCTLDVICDAAMGLSINSQDELSSEYLTTIIRVTNDVIQRMLSFLLSQWLWERTPRGAKNMKDIGFLHRYTNKIIAERRSAYSKQRLDDPAALGAKKRPAFLDRLIQFDMDNEGEWTDADMREEVDTFLFEGHDTTAALIQFALFELGHNPEIQEMAYEEQYEIFGNDSREATLNDLQRMNYLERVIKECLRLYPSVPYIARLISEDLQLNDLPAIPAGTNAVVVPFFLHRNEKYFPDPDKFDPDRFLPDECKARHPFAYIPFSAGPRNCIGQRFAMTELKMFLSTVLRFSKVESVTKKSDLHLVPVLILRPAKPLVLKILPRN